MKGLGIELSQTALHSILGEVGTYSAKLGDYHIRIQDFVKLMAPYMRVKPSSKLSEDQLKKLKQHFSKIDTNGNGTIETGELYDLFYDAGMDKSDAEIDDLMAQYDADKNGVLSFDEFISMILDTM
eukprot:TRINITY_DN822_c0_g1_i1.p1 TRINITY_DN822_c0_g1~~TRINITY_DN822_c0_g1_i1.p1  ORF type:complete len:126 (+),score=31.00 TRINITY_DN822_c0_g1_i1:853-1230(+)